VPSALTLRLYRPIGDILTDSFDSSLDVVHLVELVNETKEAVLHILRKVWYLLGYLYFGFSFPGYAEELQSIAN